MLDDNTKLYPPVTNSMKNLSSKPMSEEAVTLGLILKNLDNFDMSTFDGRLIFQKTVYLMQAFGVYIGHSFSWYLRGPYSSHLADVGFQLQEVYDEIPKGGFNNSAHKKFEKFLQFMDDKKDDPVKLEILASAHFVKKLYPDMPKSKIIQTVQNKQEYFTKKQCEDAWTELEGRGLL